MLSFAAFKPRGVKHIFDDFHLWSGIGCDGGVRLVWLVMSVGFGIESLVWDRELSFL